MLFPPLLTTIRIGPFTLYGVPSYPESCLGISESLKIPIFGKTSKTIAMHHLYQLNLPSDKELDRSVRGKQVQDVPLYLIHSISSIIYNLPRPEFLIFAPSHGSLQLINIESGRKRLPKKDIS